MNRRTLVTGLILLGLLACPLATHPEEAGSPPRSGDVAALQAALRLYAEP